MRKTKMNKTKNKSRVVRRTKTHRRISTGIKNVHNLFILDRSGSMDKVRDVTIRGFNEQVQTIRDQEKKSKQTQIVSFVTFNQLYNEKFFNQKSSQLQELRAEDYIPDGGTALNDAVGKAVTKLRNELNGNKDTAVIVTILTDGEENSSREYTTQQVADLIKEVQDKLNWTVTYIGANQDVKLAAQTYNLKLSNTMRYDSDPIGTSKAFSKLSSARTLYSASLSTVKSVADVTTDSFFNSKNEVEDANS